MKTNERKYIALLTLISILMVSLFPVQSFALEESEPEVFIVVEKVDEEEDSQPYVKVEAKEEEKTVSDKSSETEKTEEKDESHHDLLKEAESANAINDFTFGLFSLTKNADMHNHDGINFTEWTSANSLPVTEGNYYLVGDVTIGSTWNVPSGTTNLCLNGHAIVRTGAEGTTGSAIQVGSGAVLALYDCGTETRYYTVANPAVNGARLGTVVDKSAYDAAGENARGTFTGGYITGGNITGAADGNHLIGGGVNVDCGKFTMYAGTIIGNKVCINAGGVKVKGAGASFTMNGGAILANYNDCYGGAISVGDNNAGRLCTVTINGGTIAHNWSGRNGGALHVDGKGHTITITGGSMVNNYTNGNYDNGSVGRSGGGVIKDGGNFKISGDPVIKDNLQGGNAPNNVYVFRESDVPVLSGLTSGADVGVYYKGLTSSSDVKLAAGAQKEDLQYLHFDVPSEGSLIYCDGSKDWICKSGEYAEFTGAHHTHEAGTVWATAYVSAPFEGNGTEEQPYLIRSAEDWNTLSEHINSGGTQYNGKYYKLTEDISVSTVLGNRPDTTTDSEDNPFIGTFDGDGHTLNVNINDPVFAAPFAVAHNATIKNINVTGSVTSTSNHASGLVAASKGKSIYDVSTLKIQNVRVSADIRCNSHIAGIVGHAHAVNIIMENVMFDGSLSASSVQGGFIGWGGITGGTKYNASFKDCIFAGTYRGGVAFYPVAFASGQGTATLQNDFYTTSFGSGGSPIAPTGNGQVKLLVAAVEKDGVVKYFDNIATALDGANWTDGSTLKLMKDASYSSKIILTNGERTFDLNGKTFTRTVVSDDGTVFDVNSGAKLTVTDTSAKKNGVITRQQGEYGGTVLFTRDSGSTINFNAGRITGMTSRVIIAWQGSTVNMSGGEISGNILNNGDATDGIVRTYSSNSSAGGTFNMTGGKIINNILGNGKTGGAVYVGNNGTFNLSGNVQISGNTQNGKELNVYLPSGKTINIADELSGDSSVGITLKNGTGVFTSGLSGKGTESNFTSDSSNYMVDLKNGEACITNKVKDVTASGYEGGYDGNAHSITVSAPDGAAVKYGTEEGSYALDTCPSYTDVGTYTVYYEVSKEGFDPSTGSATVKINPIDATVTIIGKTDTAEYDEKAHSVNGYDAVANSDLYDVANNIKFNGSATASQTNAGTSYMGLTAEQFENTNSNFNNVVFVVTDGYQTITPTNAVITTIPKTKGILVYNGLEQELIDEGSVTGGTFYYAIGDDESSPDDAEYKTETPKASEAGYYYIWYKVKGDENYNDIAPAYIKTTLAEEDWVTVSGVVRDSDEIPVGNAIVKLMQGNKIVDKTRSDSDGGYYFAVPAGLYNIVIITDNATITNMVDVSENITKDVDVLSASTESLLDVVNSDKSIVVGGLNEEAYAVRTSDSVSAHKNVAVKLTVKSISEDDTEGAKKIAEDEADKNLEFFDLKVEKNVDSIVTELTDTQNILEFAIPCTYVNKRGLVAYHYHGSEILTLTEISSKAEKADGTFYVDKENKVMYVYLSRFSTIAIGYTPYYLVKSNISLGSFNGNVSVTITKKETGETIGEKNDVSLDDISFSNIPKGNYTMTIKWEDGAVNILPVSISVK